MMIIVVCFFSWLTNVKLAYYLCYFVRTEQLSEVFKAIFPDVTYPLLRQFRKHS